MRPIVRLASRSLASFRTPFLALALLGAAALPGTAVAMDSCSGEFSASPLRALPVPAVVTVDQADSSPTDNALADAFTRGMSNAGAKVPGAQPATVALRLTWEVLGQGGTVGPDSTGGAAQQQGNSATFLQGGIDRSSPGIPEYDAFRPGQSAQSGLLVFRAEARDPTGATIYWIGSVQCTLRGSDNQKLAFDLGQLIGGALGQRRDRVSM